MMDAVIGTALDYFFGLAINLNSDYILSSQRNRHAQEILQDEQTREALRAWRPRVEEVRLLCLELADQHEKLWTSPQQQQLRALLRDTLFHQDFLEWLQVGGIEEGEPVKARIIKKMESLLAPAQISEEQREFLHQHFFDTLEKATFANDVLARWRNELNLRVLREEITKLTNIVEANMGIYSQVEQHRVIDLYCQIAQNAWDIIDLSGLPHDVTIATQQLLLRQLYMPLRICVDPERTGHGAEAKLNRLEEERAFRRIRDAGHRSMLDSLELTAAGQPRAIGEYLVRPQRLVVLGDPGSGKTTLLRWLATVYLLRLKNDPISEEIPDAHTLPADASIPVLIRCRDIGRDDLERSFSDVLEVHLKKMGLSADQDAKIMLSVILDRISTGEILLLIDGLDEITDRKARVMFTQQLELIAIRNPKITIIATSRIVGYREMPYRMRHGFTHGVISDLQAEDKDSFAKRWVAVTEAHQAPSIKEKSAQELINALHSNVRIQRMTDNPMMLTILALVKRTSVRLPTRRNELYAAAISVLLNWNQFSYPSIDTEEAMPQLAYLAYEMCCQGVQRLTGEEVLELLSQFRKDYPSKYCAVRRDPEKFMELLEARSSILMRSGHVWLNESQREQSAWEFRHLTFQEYLAARALIDGYYKDRDKSKSLADVIAPLAASVKCLSEPEMTGLTSITGAANVQRVGRGFVPDTWRETLRLLVTTCKHDDVDEVMLKILLPFDKEDDKRAYPHRVVLAAQCLAEEPDVHQDTAKRVIKELLGQVKITDGTKEITTMVEMLALGIWQSRWKKTLESCLIEAFIEGPSATRSNYGGVFAQLFGTSTHGTSFTLTDPLMAVAADLRSPDRIRAIRAALKVVQLASHEQLYLPENIDQCLLDLLARGGAEAHAAAWALAWLHSRSPSDPENRGSSIGNRLEPPLFSSFSEMAQNTGWRAAKQEPIQLIDALQRADASESELKKHLIGLLGKSAQLSALIPLLEAFVDPTPTVRKAGREALAWMANNLEMPLPSCQLGALEEKVSMPLLLDPTLEEPERADVLLVVALFGGERRLREVLENQEATVGLRRRAAECLGLVARRSLNDNHRERICNDLLRWLHSDQLNLLIMDEVGWAEHDQRLPLLQGASRGLQLAAQACPLQFDIQTGPPMSMLTLTAHAELDGLRVRTEVVKREIWRLPLPNGEQLEMVIVPAGEHWIGSPESEEGRNQAEPGVNMEASRLVKVKPFALSRFPITQTQWFCVANLPRLHRDLRLYPGSLKPDNLWDRYAQPGALPVDSVTWHDCQEWLQRLNVWLFAEWHHKEGRREPARLSLPGEDQWEVACRASERTPFYFGDTLDASWATYNCSDIYGPGRKMESFRKPMSVGIHGLFNHLGLAEMHGHICEWCEDSWQPSPMGKGWVGDSCPSQGVDLEPETRRISRKELKLIRGGSWFNQPSYCRAAERYGIHPLIANPLVGFRPCCLHPPGSLLGA